MAVSRCTQCQAVLLEEEAAAAACPACGGVFARPAEGEVAPPAIEAIPPRRRPWGLMAAVSVLAALVVVLWLMRPAVPPAPVPPEETDAYRSLLAEKEKEETAARAALLKLAGDLAAAREATRRVAALEKKLAAQEADAAKLHADTARQHAALEEKLGAALARATAAEKAMEEARARAAVVPGDRLDDPAGTHVVEAINNGDKVKLTGRIGTLRVKGINDGVLDAQALTARTIIFEGAVNGKSEAKLHAPGGTVTLAGINAEAKVEIDAPGGTVRTGGDLNGESRLKVLAREMRIDGSVQGSAGVTLTIGDKGAISFELLQGSAQVRWRKEKKTDSDPRLDEGEVRSGASFGKQD